MMLKTMWLASLLIFISIGGYFCDDELDCLAKKRDQCDTDQLPTQFPQTAEELLAACRAMETLASCDLEARESCLGTDTNTNRMRNNIDYVKAACQEDTPTFKAITNNLPCVERVIKSRGYRRCDSFLSRENVDVIFAHIDLLIGDNKDIVNCLFDSMDVTCEGVTFGYHCGEDVKDAVEEVEAHLRSPNALQCTPEQLEELSPFLEMYEGLLVEELALENALKRKRK